MINSKGNLDSEELKTSCVVLKALFQLVYPFPIREIKIKVSLFN